MNTMQEPIDWKAICDLAGQVGSRLSANGWTITTAESCTGGLIAGAITEIAGSSEWFNSGVVTYSNHAKHTLLGVSLDVFKQHGAVSEACVRAMATGALQRSDADMAITVSGIAGPGGATPGKPVGTVWIGWSMRSTIAPVVDTASADSTHREAACAVDARVFHFAGDRSSVREQAVYQALRGIISRTDNVGLYRS